MEGGRGIEVVEVLRTPTTLVSTAAVAIPSRLEPPGRDLALATRTTMGFLHGLTTAVAGTGTTVNRGQATPEATTTANTWT